MLPHPTETFSITPFWGNTALNWGDHMRADVDSHRLQDVAASGATTQGERVGDLETLQTRTMLAPAMFVPKNKPALPASFRSVPNTEVRLPLWASPDVRYQRVRFPE